MGLVSVCVLEHWLLFWEACRMSTCNVLSKHVCSL